VRRPTFTVLRRPVLISPRPIEQVRQNSSIDKAALVMGRPWSTVLIQIAPFKYAGTPAKAEQCGTYLSRENGYRIFRI